jgi:RNA polymerase sigma-70 factor (ECF subfamily)
MNQREGARPGGSSFETTQWSLVIAAGQSRTAETEQALAALCERYWQPLYAYIRRQGYPADRAQDLTQEFFCRLLEKNYVHDAHRERGRFRTFLLTSLKHFLANEWNRAHAQKRGGHASILSLDFSHAEDRPGYEPSHDMTPERLYERNWALTVLERALARLRDEYAAAGKAQLFEHLKSALTGDQPQIPHEDLGQRLGISEGAVKVAIHRLRKRYRALLRDEVAQTVQDGDSIEDEIRYLLAVLSA